MKAETFSATQSIGRAAGVVVVGLLVSIMSAHPALSLELRPNSVVAYVSPLGKDDASCMTPEDPCLTLQAAWTDLVKIGGTADKVIRIADGHYESGIEIVGHGDDRVSIVGDETNPARVVIDVKGSDTVHVQKARATISGIELRNTNGFGQLVADDDGAIDFWNVRFSFGGEHVIAGERGHVRAIGNYEIAVGGMSHLIARLGGTVELSSNIVVTMDNAVFLAFFAGATRGGTINFGPGVSFRGLASTRKFHVLDHGTINSGGLGVAGLPGALPGLLDKQGQYDSERGPD